MQITPHTNLSKIINHYLFINATNGIDDLLKLRFFANGNTSLVFLLDESTVSGNSSPKLPNTFVMGQVITSKDFSLSGSFSAVVVVFKPTGLYQLTGIPSFEIKSEPILSSTIFGMSITYLLEQMRSKNCPKAIINLLNVYFLDYVQGKTYHPDARFLRTIRSILLTKGTIRVSDISHANSYSERNLQRAFRKYIGLAPREYLKIVRFHNFLGGLQEVNYASLTTIALSTGYYDQSHSIRDFKDITSMTPKEYLKKTDRLAVNLICLS